MHDEDVRGGEETDRGRMISQSRLLSELLLSFPADVRFLFGSCDELLAVIDYSISGCR